MLTIDQFRHQKTGANLSGFFVRNARGNIVATGVQGVYFRMRHKRYENDITLVRAIARLTGLIGVSLR